MTIPFDTINCSFPSHGYKGIPTKSRSVSSLITKLKGMRSVDALDYIIANRLSDKRLIPILVKLLLKSKDGCVVYKASVALNNFNGFSLDKTGLLKITAQNISLLNGAVLQKGTLHFKDGVLFVSNGKSAVVSGVIINERSIYDQEAGSIGRVALSFDGKEQVNVDGAAVSINTAEKRIVMQINHPDRGYSALRFFQGNPFVPIEKNDLVQIKLYFRAVTTIESKAKEGLIPQMTVSGDGYARVLNGWLDARIGSKGVFHIYSQDPEALYNNHFSLDFKSSGAPFDIVAADGNGNLLPLKEGVLQLRRNGFSAPHIFQKPDNDKKSNKYHLVLDNYYRTALLDKKSKTGKVKTSAGKKYYSYTISRLLSDNSKTYSLSDFNSKYPGLAFTGIIDSSNIVNAMGFLGTLPPRVLAGVKGIDFPTMQEVPRVAIRGGFHSWLPSAYAGTDGVMHFLGNTVGIKTFRHEATHAWIFDLRREGSDIDSRWQDIAGDVYGKKYVEFPTAGDHYYSWKKDFGPDRFRHGCVRAYGCSELAEDQGTHGGQIGEDPKEFINHPEHKGKLDLMLEYGGITPAEYLLATESRK